MQDLTIDHGRSTDADSAWRFLIKSDPYRWELQLRHASGDWLTGIKSETFTTLDDARASIDHFRTNYPGVRGTKAHVEDGTRHD